MRLGFYMGYAQPGTSPLELLELAKLAESLGYESAWAAEAWGTDAVTPLAWLGAQTSTIALGTAIMQIPGRSPANTAMTAATLDLLSGGRVRLGLGTSGPQVVEGWHGQEWGQPLEKTREYVSIVRSALARERLEHHGRHYDIPVQGGTGLGKPLRLMLRPVRSEIPIYLAAIAPKAVEQAFEIADGWLPIFWSPEQARNVFPLDRARDGFDIAPSVPALLIDDVEAGRNALKEYYAFYIGGMGARGKNFYYDLACRFGYESEATKIQDAYLSGRKDEAAALIPAELLEKTALIGPDGYVAERLAAFRESGVTTLNVTPLAATHAARVADIERVRDLIG